MTQWRLNQKEKQKYEAAERFGLMPRLLENGWPGLSAKEAGRIGGAVRGLNRARPHD
ncbi:MAG: small acid-soluble spore protein alpha/beta type [Clostridia bacterium]|nr:small acid-soluble spore protein alpha/beta type [Clostridia bacterium]